MSEVFIKENHLETDLRQFQFDDELPVVAAYARLATVSQDGESNSIKAQLHSVRHICNEKFGDNAYHLISIVDHGCSGNLPCKKPRLRKGAYRPGLTLVTRLIENGLMKYLAVWDMSRLARNLQVWLELQKNYLEPYNIQLISATEPFFSGSESSGVASVLHLIAEFQLSQIRKASMDGQKALRDAGYTLGKSPYGWVYEDRREAPEGRHVGIKPVPEQAKVVRRMFDMLMSGRNAGCIARELTDAGIPPPGSSPCWSPRAVRRIMLKPVHAGLLRRDGESVPAAHYDLRIIDGEVYKDALGRLTAHSRGNGSKSQEEQGKNG
ncbi:MAG: recombinase family protein [Armatimonadota bacterium]